jgi:hypothetical protein
VLTIGTFFWGVKYSGGYVSKLRDGIKRHLKEPHRFVVFHPDPRDDELKNIPGCFSRLRAFEPEWQARNGIDDRLVVVDLDVVVTGALDDLFRRPEPFLILKGANQSNPNPMNGSLWMLRPGYRPDVWSDFSLEAAANVPHYEFPDDQAWLNAKIPDAAGWNAGPESGIWSFAKRGWPKDNRLPDGAKLVVFPGWRDPSKFEHLDWVRNNWYA